MAQYTGSVDWGDVAGRQTKLFLLPIGADGEMRSIPAQVTRIEGRFVNALIRFSSREQIEMAIEYAMSDRA